MMRHISLFLFYFKGTDWLEGSGPNGGLLQLSAGFNTLWALTRDKKCWALKGDLQEVIVQSSPAFEWIEIPGKMKSISVGRSDEVSFVFKIVVCFYFLLLHDS